jgi:mRNA-degrading endonuclease RelE of RelBE toxin-antitoxin system
MSDRTRSAAGRKYGMNYEVYLTDTFQKSLKILKKKYRHIKDDIIDIIRKLESDAPLGDPVPGWDREIWKIRVASADMKRGKSGAFRIIYLFKENDFNIYLLTVYFKGDKDDVSSDDIGKLLKNLCDELENL